MPVFVYTGRTRGGQTITGEMDAGNRELCAMNADGSGLFNITSHPANDWASDWGP